LSLLQPKNCAWEPSQVSPHLHDNPREPPHATMIQLATQPPCDLHFTPPRLDEKQGTGRDAQWTVSVYCQASCYVRTPAFVTGHTTTLTPARQCCSQSGARFSQTVDHYSVQNFAPWRLVCKASVLPRSYPLPLSPFSHPYCRCKASVLPLCYLFCLYCYLLLVSFVPIASLSPLYCLSLTSLLPLSCFSLGFMLPSLSPPYCSVT
jgi:hypothetical protein